jgi:hypothetical protein
MNPVGTEQYAATRTRPRAPEVLSEVFDEEAVVVQLTTGMYYSFDRTTTRWWEAIADAPTLGEAAGRLGDYGPALDRLTSFAAYLSAERIADFEGDLPGAPAEWPGVTRFNDMADLLVLDPIHGVDPESGWPVARPEKPGH